MKMCRYCGKHPEAEGFAWESFTVITCPDIEPGRFIAFDDVIRRGMERFTHGTAPANPYTGLDEILAKGFDETADTVVS